MFTTEIQDFMRQEAKRRFLTYVQIDTTSDPMSGKHPSSENQLDLGRLLVTELEDLGLQDVDLDQHGFVYAMLPARPASSGEVPAITFCAHMDTSSSEPGKDIVPVVHENYDGGDILYDKNEALRLTPQISPELSGLIGQNIITASGDTLLGADDKAGIAEITAALATFKKFKELAHPELRIVFTPDEEIGEGTTNIDMNRLGKFGYTMDGGEMGELEIECFDAFEAVITFNGRNIHPGYAKNKMINAGAIAARYFADLPEHETPEHTENREGFFHLLDISGDETRATLKLIIRDFERKNNERRIELLERMADTYRLRYEGLGMDIEIKDQYNNMFEILDQYPDVVEKAGAAIASVGLDVLRKPIRGGTDGARLSFMGMPTPNIFTGSALVHSKTEWVSELGLQKATEVIVALCGLWANDTNGKHT
ncbi:MAG: peptidase T [Desulfobacteraceae bacterium]|nr:peptidase T [Desulfobacteraceae bacterium]